MPNILIVDDDPDLVTACTAGLDALGYQIRSAATGEAGLIEAATRAPELIVLDLGLPDLDGLDVCRRIRQWSDVPIIVLSADGTEDRKIAALDDGADDYITKPFGMRELDARIRVAIRHHRGDSDPTQTELDVGPLHLDLVHHQAELDQRPLDLTPKEFDFLAYLARHADRICTRRMILENVWGPAYRDERNYLKVYAYRIRRKLGDAHGDLLRSDPALGYRLVPPAETTHTSALPPARTQSRSSAAAG